MISCCVEGPDEVVPRLRYAIEELLRGLGKTPVWTRRVDARVYAGADPESAPPDALRFRLGPDSVEALLDPGPVETNGWLLHHGERIPLPVGVKGTHASDPRHIIDADVLGSTFWWLTGAQERSTSARDRDGRFAYAHSLQARLDCAQVPVVDRYRLWLLDALRVLGEEIHPRPWKDAKWAVALTHDIDAVRTHRVRAWLGDTVRGHPIRGIQRATGPDWRWQSLLALRDLARDWDVRSTFFVKGGATTRHDVPYRLDDPALVSFLREIRSDGSEVGLHPSYGAADAPEHLNAERSALASAIGFQTPLVRMHYLRWTEPTTSAMLRRAGFRLDSTLGFSASDGFRRGTCQPFRIYDFKSEQGSSLWELPLTVMDTTLFTHLRLTPDEAEARTLALFDEVRHVGGCAVLLWHNDMGEGAAWKSRLAVLDRLIGHATREGAAVGPLGDLMGRWGVPLPVQSPESP